jgi:hypothetical protein
MGCLWWLSELSCCIKFSKSISLGTSLMTPILIIVYLRIYGVNPSFCMIRLSKTLFCFHSLWVGHFANKLGILSNGLETYLGFSHIKLAQLLFHDFPLQFPEGFQCATTVWGHALSCNNRTPPDSPPLLLGQIAACRPLWSMSQ